MKVLSLDAEVNGLYGMAFAIAFTVREDGKEAYSWQGRCSDEYVTDEWVKTNVLPALNSMVVTYSNPNELEEAFWKEYVQHKDGCVVVAHCGSPVESGLFRRCVERDLDARQWDAPFPLHDVATLLLMNGENPTSIDSYMATHNIKPQFNGSSHHPMYDSVVTAQVFEDILKQ